MPEWLTILCSIIGGGFGLKFLEIIGHQLRFWNLDGTGIRGELWKEIRSLRATSTGLQSQVNDLHEKISDLRVAKHAAANLANWFGLRLRMAMVEVNDRDAQLKQPSTYDLAAMDVQIRQEKADAEADAVAHVKGNR